LILVRLAADNIEHLNKIVNQECVEILLDKPKRHLFKCLVALGIEIGGLFKLLFEEELVRIDAGNVGLVRGLTVLQSLTNLALFKVLFPRIFVFFFEG